MAKVEKTQLDKDMAAALALIHKQFGEDSMLTFDDTTAIKKIDTVSTGSLNLDVALGVGGLPMGRINTIYGESSSGKSTIALQLVANAQKQGYLCAYLDSEHAVDLGYAQALGVDLKHLLFAQPNDGVECFQMAEALLKQNVAFPKLLINMVKTSEMTGELPEVLDDMSNYYAETERTRKQMITALMYPSIVFVFATGVITFIMMFVIPQFVEIYETMDASQIPGFTLAVIGASEFIQNYIVWILVGIVIFILIFMYLYKNVKLFRTICQWILMHIPVIGTTVIYNEVTMFTKTFSSLLSHNVFITDSMEVLNKITNNEIYKMLILDTITNLAKGEKISKAFENHWAFPIPAYEMLVTGEKTGELAEMMGKVATYYQDLHKESVTRIKSFIEPILTVFLTAVVGVIILAVIIPMFSMYGSIQNY